MDREERRIATRFSLDPQPRGGRTRRIALTALGKATARKLLGNEAFRDLVAHMGNVNEALGRKNGNELKTMIYALFGEEVAEQPLGRVIVGLQR